MFSTDTKISQSYVSAVTSLHQPLTPLWSVAGVIAASTLIAGFSGFFLRLMELTMFDGPSNIFDKEKIQHFRCVVRPTLALNCVHFTQWTMTTAFLRISMLAAWMKSPVQVKYLWFPACFRMATYHELVDSVHRGLPTLGWVFQISRHAQIVMGRIDIEQNWQLTISFFQSLLLSFHQVGSNFVTTFGVGWDWKRNFSKPCNLSKIKIVTQ